LRNFARVVLQSMRCDFEWVALKFQNETKREKTACVRRLLLSHFPRTLHKKSQAFAMKNSVQRFVMRPRKT
jgi:hypothetical protein